MSMFACTAPAKIPGALIEADRSHPHWTQTPEVFRDTRTRARVLPYHFHFPLSFLPALPHSSFLPSPPLPSLFPCPCVSGTFRAPACRTPPSPRLCASALCQRVSIPLRGVDWYRVWWWGAAYTTAVLILNPGVESRTRHHLALPIYVLPRLQGAFRGASRCL
ncbi:hypothetical protein C8T65DRAFT_625267 [Cerioporus squamosus]|nr:hypothetical protein C8T65DRAFT_625267 [Cerioporus squamosus]